MSFNTNAVEQCGVPGGRYDFIWIQSTAQTRTNGRTFDCRVQSERRESETLVKHEFSTKTDARWSGRRRQTSSHVHRHRYVALMKKETAALCAAQVATSTAIKDV
jgi:hypothetical protein